MTNDQVVDLWRQRIVLRANEVDPGQEQIWESIWIGFVTALDRPDLATYDGYINLGFPVEDEAPPREEEDDE
jgi:hypothetical protein